MKVLIIGGVAAGPKVAAKVMRLNPDAVVTVLEKGRFLSYAGCGLPYHVSGMVKEQKELMSTPVGVLRDAAFLQKVKDARFLPWPAGSFDAVVSWNVFHHLDDPKRVFTEMIRMVKSGGKLVLADFSPSGFRLTDAIHGADGKRHPHPPNRFAYWKTLLRRSGFRTRNFSGHHEEVLVAVLSIQTS
jgi:SAM-dependent methyltransferase